MPPKKRARASHAAVATPAKDDDAMDIDGPSTAVTPATATAVQAPATGIYNDMWTEDQISSLFKGTIRWKPGGMETLSAAFFVAPCSLQKRQDKLTQDDTLRYAQALPHDRHLRTSP